MAMGVRKREKEGDKPTPTRKMSEKQEKSVAKATGGDRTPNSGATDFGGKGDVLTKEFLIECKTKMTDSKSISIQKEWLEKNNYEMVQMGKKYSTLAFNFGPDQPNYYIIDEFLFKTLQEYLLSVDN